MGMTFNLRQEKANVKFSSEYDSACSQTLRREETEKGEVRQIDDIYARASTYIVSWKQI